MSRGVGGYEAMVAEDGTGRVGNALGGAIGKGRVSERRFEFRETEDSERIDRVSLTSSACDIPRPEAESASPSSDSGVSPSLDLTLS